MLKIAVLVFLALAVHTLSQTPEDFDVYHFLHLPHRPALHPTLHQASLHQASLQPTLYQASLHQASGRCAGRARGYYADVDSGCQAYHLCWRQRVVSTELCANGTLFNEQFQVCDHFYNVRCGSPYEDL